MSPPKFWTVSAIDAPIDGFKNPLPAESIHNECSACVGQQGFPSLSGVSRRNTQNDI
jgi:hypothetical protein